MIDFTDEQIERYSRHIILKEVGGKGQEKIAESRVLVIGAGGLGSPVAYYLAAAGVGTLGIVDSDAVDLSNLQRQILHRTADVGRPKVESAREKLAALNPDVKIVAHRERLTSRNIMATLADYDVIVDGTDNFPARFLINDACVLSDKPLVHGGILRFEGQLTTIVPGRGPCYRCLFPEPPPPGFVPSCQEAGVIGAVAGVIGTLQANEVLKLILGIGETLAGYLLTVNLLTMEFRKVRIPRNKDCEVCGQHPTITEPFDYPEACELRPSHLSP